MRTELGVQLLLVIALSLALGYACLEAQAVLLRPSVQRLTYTPNAHEDFKRESLASNRLAASSVAKGLRLYHLRLDGQGDASIAGRQRGEDMAQLMGTGFQETLPEIYQALQHHLDQRAQRSLQKIFDFGMNSAASGIPSSWPFEVIRETQGIVQAGRVVNGEQASAGVLQRLLLASCMSGLIEGEGVLAQGEGGPVILVALNSRIVDPRKILVPIVTYDGAQRSVMLSLFGTSVPLAGVNERGLAFVRFAPEYSPDAFKHAVGPDAAIQARYFLMGYRAAGLERLGDGEGVGHFLLSLSDPQHSENILSRLATPGIILAADGREGYRYEWWASDARSASTPMEFEGLVDQPIAASSWFSAPELRVGGEGAATALHTEVTKLGPGVMTMSRIERVLVAQKRNELRFALIPSRRSMLVLNADADVVEISLNSLARIAWQ